MSAIADKIPPYRLRPKMSSNGIHFQANKLSAFRTFKMVLSETSWILAAFRTEQRIEFSFFIAEDLLGEGEIKLQRGYDSLDQISHRCF